VEVMVVTDFGKLVPRAAGHDYRHEPALLNELFQRTVHSRDPKRWNGNLR
jgi:hypothetical protein